MRNLFRTEPRYITVPGEARTAPGAGADRTADGLWVRCENERCRELLFDHKSQGAPIHAA